MLSGCLWSPVCLSVSLGPFLPVPLPATCPIPDVFTQGRKDAALGPLHPRAAPWGSGAAQGCKQAQNSAPHTVVSFPTCAQRLLRGGGFGAVCVTTEGDAGGVRAHCVPDNGQYLAWSFPSNKISSKQRQKCCQIKKVRFHLHFTVI